MYICQIVKSRIIVYVESNYNVTKPVIWVLNLLLNNNNIDNKSLANMSFCFRRSRDKRKRMPDDHALL